MFFRAKSIGSSRNLVRLFVNAADLWAYIQSASIKPIQRPFIPDTDKDFGHVWERQSSEQLTPQTSKLAKPNALMFFHMPLFVTGLSFIWS
jgi:hypothetical protein